MPKRDDQYRNAEGIVAYLNTPLWCSDDEDDDDAPAEFTYSALLEKNGDLIARVTPWPTHESCPTCGSYEFMGDLKFGTMEDAAAEGDLFLKTLGFTPIAEVEQSRASS